MLWDAQEGGPENRQYQIGGVANQPNTRQNWPAVDVSVHLCGVDSSFFGPRAPDWVGVQLDD